MEMTTEEALRLVYNYVEDRHHEYCWDVAKCDTCKAIETLQQNFPSILDKPYE